MSITRFGSETRTFSIKVYYDSSAMEVQAVEFPSSFERLDGLSKADLLQDVVGELDTQREENFEDYAEDVKINAEIKKSKKIKAVWHRPN